MAGRERVWTGTARSGSAAPPACPAPHLAAAVLDAGAVVRARRALCGGAGQRTRCVGNPCAAGMGSGASVRPPLHSSGTHQASHRCPGRGTCCPGPVLEGAGCVGVVGGGGGGGEADIIDRARREGRAAGGVTRGASNPPPPRPTLPMRASHLLAWWCLVTPRYWLWPLEWVREGRGHGDPGQGQAQRERCHPAAATAACSWPSRPGSGRQGRERVGGRRAWQSPRCRGAGCPPPPLQCGPAAGV